MDNNFNGLKGVIIVVFLVFLVFTQMKASIANFSDESFNNSKYILNKTLQGVILNNETPLNEDNNSGLKQGIIEITKAEHLDSEKNFIGDFYNQVKTLDNSRATIGGGEYLRVVFEKLLDKTKDITIYAKSNSTNASVEVYEKDSDVKLADFGIINNEKKYQVFLTNLVGLQDTFDLLVKGGVILFNYIVDPIVTDESSVAQIYQTNIFQDADTEISVQFNNETIVGSKFTHPTNTKLQFNNAGWYKISYGCLMEETIASGARQEQTMWLENDTGDEIMPSRTYTYLRNDEDGQGDFASLSGVTIVNMSEGGNLTLQTTSLYGARNVDPEESCWLYAEELHRPAVLVRETTDYDTLITTGSSFNQDFGETVYEDSDVFTSDLTNNWVSVDEDGWYKIYYVAGSEQTVGTNDNDRTTPSSYIYINDTSALIPSQTYSYHKRADQAAYSTEEGYTMAYLTSGENVSLRRYLSEQQITTPGETYTLKDSWLMIEKLEDNNILLIYDSAGGQGITGSAATQSAFANITWDTNSQVGSYFTHTSGQAQFTIEEDGWFEISYAVSFDASTGSNRKVSCARVLKNGVPLEPSYLCEYERDSTVEDNSVAANFIVNNTAGDEYVVQHAVTPQKAGGGHTLIADSSWVSVTPIKVLDVTNPNVSIVSPSSINYSTQDIWFNVSAVDNKKVDSCWYNLDNGQNITMSNNSNIYYHENTSVTEGQHTAYFFCNDSSNNINDSESVEFGVDVTLPSLVLYEPQNISYNHTDLSINYSVSDVNLDSCWYTNDSGVTNYSLPGCQNISYTAQQDSTIIEVYANDSAGNQNSSIVTFFVDSIYPLIDFAPNAYSDGAVITGESIFVNVTVIESNEKNITFYLYNSTHGPKEETYFTDGSRTVNWNLLSDGVYYYNVTIYDILNNFNFTETRNITLDNTAPIVDFTTGTEENGANKSQNWIYVNTSVIEDNFANITFYLYNSSNDLINKSNFTDSTRSINWSGLADGSYYYNVTVIDKANQFDSTNTRQINLDTTFPTIDFTIGTEQDGANLSQSNIFVNVTVNETNEANTTFYLYNSSMDLINNQTYFDETHKHNFTSLADGIYYYNVTIFDYSSNFNFTETRKITLDINAPNAILNTPENESYVNDSTQNMTVNATDNLGLKNATLFVYNSTSDLINKTNVNISGTQAAAGIIYEFLYDGVFNWFYRVFDWAGNWFDTGENMVTVDTINPLISYAGGVENNDTNFSRDWIYVNVTVNETNEANITFGLYNSGGEVNVTTYTSPVREINWTGLPDGLYYYNVTVVDFALRENFTITNWIRLDDTSPTINILQPQAIAYPYNESLPLNVSVADNLVGLDSCWWNLDDGSNNSITCGQNTTFDTSQGQHTLNFYSNDTLNNLASDSVTFSVSLGGPAIVLLAPANETFFSAIQPITFNFTATSPAGISECLLYGDWNGGWHLNKTIKDDWWNESWDYRNKLNVTAGSNVTTDYTVDIGMDTTGPHFKDDADDLRVVYWNGTDHVEINRLVVRPNKTDSRVQFKLQANISANSSDMNYSVYYGNPQASNPPNNASKIWYFYDDFSQGNTNMWGPATAGYRINTSYTNPWSGVDSVLELGVGCGSDVMKVNQTYFPVTRDAKIRALWYDNPELQCTGGSPDADGILGVRGNPSTTGNDGILLEWDTDTGFHYDVGATGSVAGDFIPFETWIWTESVAYGTDATGHKGKHWNFTDDEPSTYPLQATAVSATSSGVPYIRTASGTALVAVVFASLLVEVEPTVTIQDEAWDISTVVNFNEDGDFKWNVICTDNNDQGDFALNNLTFSIDGTNPLIDYGGGIAENGANLSQSNIFVNVTVTEDNEENITFYLYNSSMDLVNNQTYFDGTHEHNFTSLVDGTYYYNVTVYDKALHYNSTQTRFITLDTENPNATLLLPENNTYTNKTYQNFTTNATDNNGLLNATLYIFNQTGSLIYNATQSVSGLVETLAGITYTFLADGVFKWFYEVVDLAGNTYSTENRTIIIDTVYPEINFTFPTENNDTSFQRNWIYVNVSANETNEANITFGLYNSGGKVNVTTFTTKIREINWTGLSDGLYYYNVTVIDLAVQKNYTQTRTIRLDNTPPSVVIDSPLSKNYSTALIWFNITTDGAVSCNYTIDGGTTNHTMATSDNLKFSANNSSVSDGAYTANFYCADSLGNLNNSEYVQFGVDSTFPQISFIEGTEDNDTYFQRNWIYINVSVNETNEANITYNLYKDGAIDFTNTYTDKRREINITNRVDGKYYYNVTVVDTVGNTNSTETRWITLDNVNPVVNYESGTAENNSNKSQDWIYVNVSVTEENFANITFELYNSSNYLLNKTNFSDSTRSINWSGLSEGTYYYNVTVYDLVNLKGSTLTRKINLEYTNPLINFVNSTEDNGVEVERDWIYVNVSVTEEHEKNITFLLYNETGEVNSTTFNTSVREINWTGLNMANVTYYYNVTVHDNYENQNSTETRQIKLIDITNPFVKIVKPEAKVYGYNESLPLDFIAVDSGVGIDSCWYNIDGGTNVTLVNCANSTFNVSGDGGYLLTLYANDSIGNINQSSVSFTISLLGPGITLVSPADGENFTGFNNSYFNFTAVDPDGIQNCSLYGNWNGGWHLNQTKEIGWWDNDWNYRKEINVTNGGTSTLLNFPIFINVTNESSMQDDYGDLRFINGTCTSGQAIELPYEIEGYDSNEADVWVKFNVSSGINSICMYYGNPSVSNGENPTEAWDSIFESVYHLDNSASGTAPDVLSHYSMSEVSSVTDVQGIFNNATDFDGGLDELNSPDGWRDTTSTPTTWEAWVKTTSGTAGMIIMEDGGGSVGIALGMDSGLLGFYMQGATGQDVVSPTGGYNDGAWHYVVGVHSASANILYVDGEQVNSGSGASTEAGTGNSGIGGASSGVVNDLSNNFNGSIDEVRFSDGQRTADWINLTYQNIQNYANTINVGSQDYGGEFNFKLNVTEEGIFKWNVECSDGVYSSFAGFNYTFSLFFPVDQIDQFSFNITQTSNDGKGNITLYWNATNHTYNYRIYYSDDLKTIKFLNSTFETNYTDSNFSGNTRRFYRVDAWNPLGPNYSTTYLAAHVYTLKHNGNTRNWIGFPTNITYLTDANQSLDEITNATSFTMWNATLQQRVTCNNYSCPMYPSCTLTNCNFNIDAGEAYEVNINSSAPSSVNWSGVGITYNPVNINLVKNSTSFGKNWISMTAYTNLSNANDLLTNITNADAVSRWNNALQTSEGLIPVWGMYLGENFNITLEEGYEVSVTGDETWEQL